MSARTDAGPGAHPELWRAVSDATDGDPLAPVTVVAPSTVSAVFLRRAMGAEGGGDLDRGRANVTTVDGLLRTLASPELAARDLRPVPAVVDLELIRATARESEEPLARLARHPRTVVALQASVNDLRRCPTGALASIGRRHGPGAAWVRLLRSVRARLHDNGWADTADVTAYAQAQARRGGTAVDALGTVVCWDLAHLSPDVRAMLGLLGARPLRRGAGDGAAATFTELRLCPDPDEEVHNALGAVIAAAADGVPLSRQAIFHPPGPLYARIVHQHLAAAGVPASGPDIRPLHRSTTGRALLGLLQLAGSEWRRDQVMAWLSAAPVADGPGRPPVPATRWDSLSAIAGVVRGPAQWQARLARLVAGGGADAAEAAALGAFVDDLVARAAAPRGSWRAFAAWALDLLDHYLHPGGKHADAVASGRDPLWPDAEHAAAAQVRGIVEQLGELEPVAPDVDLASFRQAVRTHLESVPPSDPQLTTTGFENGVFVAPYSRGRGVRFHTVVVTGLADDLVPGPEGDDGLLTEDIRRLDPSGTLRTRAERRADLREDLGGAVASGTHDRIGTRPRGDPRSGRVHVPSRWLRQLTGPGARQREVDSFAAGLAGPGPAVSAREQALRQLYRCARTGEDPARSALAAELHLVDSFQAARARAGTRFTRFDGYVGPRRVSPFDASAPVSATRFETYARCPRRYLFERVLGVSARVRPEELWRIEPMTRGSIVHAILEQYVRQRIDGAPRSLGHLLAIADDHLTDAAETGLAGRPLLWRMDRAAILRDLRRFHSEDGDGEPIAAELSFGTDADDAGPPVTVTFDDGRTVAFRGSADRVDRTPSGRLLVSDYKTGRQAGLNDLTRDPVAGGRLLQLPLYAMAARARFATAGPVHTRYWLLSGDRSAPCYHLVVTPDVQERFEQVVRHIAEGVDDGCFPGVPGPPALESFRNCLHCDFDRVCPPTRQRQWSRKYNAPGLRGVTTLLDGRVPGRIGGTVVKAFVDPDDPEEQ